MPAISKARKAIATVGSIALVLTLGSTPLLVSGADHLDAPSLGHVSVDAMGNVSVAKVNGRLDIADLYVFKSATAGKTVLAMTVNPAINLLGPKTFAQNGVYTFNIDLSGDARVDRSITVTFGEPEEGTQHYVVRATGTTVASGFTADKGKSWSRDGWRAFAGPRSDPFFFDLLGFLGSVKGQGIRRFNDGKQSDFFVGLNTLGIVLEVPNSYPGWQRPRNRRLGDHRVAHRTRPMAAGGPDRPPGNQHRLQCRSGGQGGVQPYGSGEPEHRHGRQVPLQRDRSA